MNIATTVTKGLRPRKQWLYTRYGNVSVRETQIGVEIAMTYQTPHIETDPTETALRALWSIELPVPSPETDVELVDPGSEEMDVRGCYWVQPLPGSE